jgi:hypothetical protein
LIFFAQVEGLAAKLPAAAVGNTRNAIYLASEALRFARCGDKVHPVVREDRCGDRARSRHRDRP